MIQVLCVCLGNICRSPTAEAVLRHKLMEAGLEQHVFVDSAGTGGWHIGDSPDQRAQQVASDEGYALIHELRGRQISIEDRQNFDYIYVMDSNNMRDVQALFAQNPEKEGQAQLNYFLGHSDYSDKNVPDPYYGERQDFEDMLTLIEQGADDVIAFLKQQHGL
ncbi:MAG: low molecular weight protein-tyrosine-phosphatase [Pseudomonadota bacterium]|nr:low molecular weight protein-tyrosine-phosphatase [Pseudomonadota bacterium]